MLHSSYDVLYALIATLIFVIVVQDIVCDLLLTGEIRASAKEMGVRDRGEVAGNHLFNNKARCLVCKEVVRVGILRDAMKSRAPVRYCWKCEVLLGPDADDTSAQPLVLALPAPEQSSAEILQFAAKPKKAARHQKNPGQSNDPPTAA